MRWIRPGLALLLTWLVVGQALAEGPTLKSVRIAGIPHIQQKPDFCGEACVAMYCDKLGVPIGQGDVFTASGLDPALGRGCWTRELSAAVKRLGFKPGSVWYSVKISDADPKGGKQLEALFARMHAELRAGYPSIVCMRYGFSPGATEHFRLITGYDAAKDEVIYHEPAVADGADRRMSRADFLKLWPLKYRKDRWTVVMLTMQAEQLRPPTVSASQLYTEADYAQHVRALKKKLPSGFNIVMSKPFVVIGDEPLDTVKMRSQRTVQWAVTRLKKAYFTKDPTRILNIWLFKDKASYEKHCKQLFGFAPHTPFGFYSDTHGALVMNIATGGGTLVHELTHALMEPDFPEAPTWFDEGLASLHEQCSIGEDRIVGRVNWRRPALRAALDARRLRPLRKLITKRDFRTNNKGLNYAHARYFVFYMQERGLLGAFYRRFRDTHRPGRPTDVACVERTFGQGLDEIDRAFRAWLRTLRYRHGG